MIQATSAAFILIIDLKKVCVGDTEGCKTQIGEGYNQVWFLATPPVSPQVEDGIKIVY